MKSQVQVKYQFCNISHFSIFQGTSNFISWFKNNVLVSSHLKFQRFERVCELGCPLSGFVCSVSVLKLYFNFGKLIKFPFLWLTKPSISAMVCLNTNLRWVTPRNPNF
jgi:hypothetical protein